MRGLTDIQVRSLIVHVLDAKSTTRLVKSWRPVPIAPNDRVSQYFAKHITSSMSDVRAMAAVFRSLTDGDISRICGGLLDGNVDLVSGSHLIADRLYEIMARDKRIASGDLAVCTFTAGNPPSPVDYLALLKLDPSLAVWHRTEYDAEGRPYVTFEVADNVLPTVTERLQKCAFVRQLAPRGEFDLLVLDDQIGERPGENVARFFLHEFLDAMPLLDPEIATDRLISALRVGQREVRRLLSDEQRSDLELITRAALRRVSVNLDDLVETLPIPAEAKTKFDEVLRRDVADRVITIDASVVNAQLPKRKFRGTGGLRIDIPADLYPTMFEGATTHVDEHGNEYIKVVLHTQLWEEITKP